MLIVRDIGAYQEGNHVSSKMAAKRAAEISGNRNAVGESIRRYRKAIGWPLKVLSDACGVPVSTLSKVENGAMSLKIDKLLAVCRALDIDIMQLVAPDEGSRGMPQITGRRSITRQDSVATRRTDNALYEHHAHDFSKRRMSPAVMTVDPGDPPQLLSHQGEEFIFVLAGRVEVLTEFYEPTVLGVGESIYIDSTMGHNVRALDGVPARILNVSTAARTPAP